jgi:M6 family metalloprotease-like protein
MLFRILYLLIVLIPFTRTISHSQNSEHGYWLPNKGTLRVLLVYAEVIGDANYSVINDKNWPPGDMPVSPELYFNNDGNNQGQMTAYFDEASHGTYRLEGDYLPYLIQIDASEAGYGSMKSVLNKLNEIKVKKIRTANGYLLNKDFDLWTTTAFGEPKINVSDSLMDLIMVVWRVNSKLSPSTNSGYCATGTMNQAFLGFKGVNCYSEFVSHANDAFVIMRHEFSHTLYGGNNFHTAGCGAGRRTFMPSITGYSNMSSWDNISQAFNAWDRWRMGWKNSEKQYQISSWTKNGIYYKEFDFENYSIRSQGADSIFYIRDFRTSGDAIRIQLPGPDSPQLRQYLWLEYRTDSSFFDIPYKNRSGLYAYIQVGKDNKKNIYSNGNQSPGNYLYFHTARGRFDFSYIKDKSNKYTLAHHDLLPNPMSGNHYLMRPIDDLNQDGALSDNELILPEFIERNGEKIKAYPAFGSEKDAFRYNEKNSISIQSNPAAVNVTTYNFPNHNTSSFDTDTIYLSGLHIQIIDSSYNVIQGKTSPTLSVKITWGDYYINKSVRWCGNILLKAFSENTTLTVKNGGELLLDRGLSPTKHTINKSHPVDGKLYFSQPTVFICEAGTTLRIESGAVLSLKHQSKLIIKKGAELQLDRGAILSVDDGCEVIYE